MSNKQSISVSYNRTNKAPLDDTDTFDTGIEAQTYASQGITNNTPQNPSSAYLGQVVCINNIDSPSLNMIVPDLATSKFVIESINYETLSILEMCEYFSLNVIPRKGIDTMISDAACICPNNISTLPKLNKSTLRHILLPQDLTTIKYREFADCTSLESIVLPNSLEIISDSAFENCTSIKTIIIPCNVSVISNSAFAGCTNLTTVIISEGVSLLEEEAFSDCGSLKKAHIPHTITWIGDRCFYNCSNDFNVYYNGTEAEFNVITPDNWVNKQCTVTFVDGTTKKFFEGGLL